MEIQNLPVELQNKVFYFMSHPCADMMKQNINEQFEHQYVVYSFKERFTDTGITTKEELRTKHFRLWEAEYYFVFNHSRLKNLKHTKRERELLYKDFYAFVRHCAIQQQI